MTKYIDEMNYDELVEKSLRNVVYYALKIVEDQGLPGENHFYITFDQKSLNMFFGFLIQL